MPNSSAILPPLAVERSTVRITLWGCLEERKAAHFWNRRLLEATLADIPVDLPARAEMKLHGHTIDQLISFLPVGLQATSAPFIHSWLKTGVEDLNQLVSAIQYLGILTLMDGKPSCSWLKQLADSKQQIWQQTVRLNARLVRAAKQLSYRDCWAAGHLDALNSCESPYIRYVKNDGIRLQPEPFEMFFYCEKYSSRVTGWVSKGAQLDNIPYLNAKNRLMVVENGKWVEVDGDWSPVSVDIEWNTCTYKQNRMEKPLWYEPSGGIIASLLGKDKYDEIVREVYHSKVLM